LAGSELDHMLGVDRFSQNTEKSGVFRRYR
jgi:hypothetical protein